MDRRTFIASAVGTAVATALPPARAGILGFGRGRGLPTQAKFDFYISTTGSDSNTGSLSSPWAITSLSLVDVAGYAYNSSAQNCINCLATAGKRVGFLPGSTYYLTTAFTGTIASGSNQMTVSGVTGALVKGMALVSGLGSAFTTSSYGWGPKITAISGSTITLSSNAAAALSGATIVATFMKQDPVVGAIQIVGSSNSASPTYWGVSDSNGNEVFRSAGVAGTVILDAVGGSGVYGGFISGSVATESGPIIDHSARYPTTYTAGNVTIRGLVLKGWSYRGIRIGAYSSGDGPANISGVTLQDLEMTDGNASGNTQGDNVYAIWDDCTVGAVITNNWIHDNVGVTPGSCDHLNAVILFGNYNGGSTAVINSGTVIEYNTCVNAGNLYGKDGAIDSTTAQFNYLDVSSLTNAGGIQDFTGAGAGTLSGTTSFHHNVILFNATAQEGGVFGGATASFSDGFTTPVQVYNNTVIVTTGGIPTVPWLMGSGGAAGATEYYNNIYVNQSTSGGNSNSKGNQIVNPSAPSVWDYNLVYSPNVAYSWTLYQNASFTTAIGTYTTAAAFASALSSNGGISGAESHSIVGSAPTFTNTGTYASLYRLASGSVGAGAGSTNGTTSGSATDMGAWGNGATQVGCSFAT